MIQHDVEIILQSSSFQQAPFRPQGQQTFACFQKARPSTKPATSPGQGRSAFKARFRKDRARRGVANEQFRHFCEVNLDYAIVENVLFALFRKFEGPLPLVTPYTVTRLKGLLERASVRMQSHQLYLQKDTVICRLGWSLASDVKKVLMGIDCSNGHAWPR